MPAFKDIGKGAKDLFDAGEYKLNREVEISANEDNVNLTATTTMENDSDFTTEVEYSQGNFTVALDTKSNQSVTYDNIKFSGMKAKLKFARQAGNPNANDTLEATVKCPKYNVEMKVKADSELKVKTDTSFVFAKDNILAGLKVPFDVSNGFDPAKISVGFQFAKGDNTFALTSTNPMAQNLAFSYLRAVNSDLTAALGVNYSPDAAKNGCGGDMLNLGARYNIDGKSSFQGFATFGGDIKAKYSYDFSKRLSASAAFGTTIKNPFSVSTGFKLNFN